MGTVMNMFQKKVLDALGSVLEKHRIKKTFENAGERDKHLHLRVGEMGLDVWIYDDEVAFRLGSHHLQCEKQDFDHSSDMVRFFVEQLTFFLDYPDAEAGEEHGPNPT